MEVVYTYTIKLELFKYSNHLVAYILPETDIGVNSEFASDIEKEDKLLTLGSCRATLQTINFRSDARRLL